MKLFKYCAEDLIHRVSPWKKQCTEPRSKFDELLCQMWDEAQAQGYFRYTLDNLHTKILPGKYEFVAQLNVKRAVQRRKPQDFSSVSQPFNPLEFNFTKVAQHEILFGLRNNDKGKANHMMIINVSPLEYGNCLFVPDLDSCLPQILTQESIEMGIELILLSSTAAFRVGFNSLCANASVNHHHLHVFYLNHRLKIETICVKRLMNDCYTIEEFPCKGFAFCLTERGIPSLAKNVHQLTSFLQSHDYAHNMFITRGPAFDSMDSDAYDSVRVYVWVRKPVYGAKDDTAFNVACCELSGHLPIKNSEAFKTITEEEVIGDLQDVCEGPFEKVLPAVMKLFADNQQTINHLV